MNRSFYRNLFLSLVLISLIFLQVSCSKPSVQKFEGHAQGTTYHISFWSVPAIEDKNIQNLTEAEFNRLDKLLSNYRNDSDIEILNKTLSREPIAVNEEIISLIEQARIVSVASQGCYDLTIKPLFDLWGFKAEKFFAPDEATLQATLNDVGFNKIEVLDKTHLRKLNPELKIDLSSIAQGYSVSRIAALLEKQHIENYLVEIGGELQTRGVKPDGEPWRIALEKPLPDERTLQKIITIGQSSPQAIMTSGTYRHYFDVNGKRYSHILDARTGSPINHNTVSVTVFDADPTHADAWSTALLCLGREAGVEAANKSGIAALFIENQNGNLNEYNSSALDALHTITIK